MRQNYDPPKDFNLFLDWYDEVFHRGQGLAKDQREKGAMIKLIQKRVRIQCTEEYFDKVKQNPNIFEEIKLKYFWRLDVQNQNYVL